MNTNYSFCFALLSIFNSLAVQLYSFGVRKSFLHLNETAPYVTVCSRFIIDKAEVNIVKLNLIKKVWGSPDRMNKEQ